MAQNGIAFLMVYVDDFKMVSHRNDTKQLWDPIRKHITMAEPAPSERFLGCYNRRFSAPISAFGELMGNLPSQWSRLDATGVKRTKAEPWQPADPGKIVIGFEYHMTSFDTQILLRFSWVRWFPWLGLRAFYAGGIKSGPLAW